MSIAFHEALVEMNKNASPPEKVKKGNLEKRRPVKTKKNTTLFI